MDLQKFVDEELVDFEKMKPKVYVQLVNADRNAKSLAEAVHRRVEDLALVYRVNVADVEDGKLTSAVSLPLLAQWGISEEQLYAIAMENSMQMYPGSMKNMRTLMAEMMGVPEAQLDDINSHLIYVVTNSENHLGAAALFYPGAMDAYAKQLGCDFYMLPSSIHEVLLLPDDASFNASAASLKNMISDVNFNEVAEHDQLSNQAYHYDAKAGIFETAERFEERMQEKQMAAGKKPSLLGGLKEHMEQKPSRGASPKQSKNRTDNER